MHDEGYLTRESLRKVGVCHQMKSNGSFLFAKPPSRLQLKSFFQTSRQTVHSLLKAISAIRVRSYNLISEAALMLPAVPLPP